MTLIKKFISRVSISAIILFIALLLPSTLSFSQNTSYEAIRLNNGDPIIYPKMFKNWYDRPNVSKDGGGGSNINGPSLIRVPDWIPTNERAHPTAQYYLYFAHHAGDYIRMAWAANIEGPYTLYDDLDGPGEEEDDNPSTILPANLGKRGVLDNGEANIVLGNNTYIEENHLASPDVLVDDANQRIILYFHSGSSYYVNNVEQNDQVTWVSTSPYGLEFRDNIEPVHLGSSYFRIFEHGNEMYALDNGGKFNRALDAANPWDIPSGHNFTTQLWDINPTHIFQDAIPESSAELRVRHTGVRVVGDDLHVFYSRRGDIQERIQLSIVDMSVVGWENWVPTYPPADILAPNPGWEGGDRDLKISETSDQVNENQLRDPDFFQDADGKMYVIYSGNGEDGIGIARLYETPTTNIALTTIADTHIREDKLNDNYGSLSRVRVSRGPDQFNRTIYMKFDLSQITSIEHAVVRLYTTDVVATNEIYDNASNTTRTFYGGPVTAYKVSDSSWGETSINASNAPSLGNPITTNYVTNSGQYYDWNITEYAKDNLVNGVFTVAFDISPTNLNGSYEFGSKDASNPPAQLLIKGESPTLSTENVNVLDKMVLTAYPNPFINNITLDVPNYDGQSAVLVKLISLSGSTLISKEVYNKTVDLSDITLPTGIYFLKVNYNDDQTLIKKMIKVD